MGAAGKGRSQGSRQFKSHFTRAGEGTRVGQLLAWNATDCAAAALPELVLPPKVSRVEPSAPRDSAPLWPATDAGLKSSASGGPGNLSASAHYCTPEP